MFKTDEFNHVIAVQMYLSLQDTFDNQNLTQYCHSDSFYSSVCGRERPLTLNVANRCFG